MEENVFLKDYKPTTEDVSNVKKITDFLDEEGIPYTFDEETYGLIHVTSFKGEPIELRYVNSVAHKVDLSKRFPDDDFFKGAPRGYFQKLSVSKSEEGVRVIWIFDFEINQRCDVVDMDGNTIKDYPRQFNVIKNTIKTACGKINLRVRASECEICILDSKRDKGVEKRFLELYCFYGNRPSSLCYGLRLKKDKYGMKKGTLLYVYSFGNCYYGNKKREEDDKLIEIIRVSTMLGVQVIGAASKVLKYFLTHNETLEVGDKKIPINTLCFFVDASHNAGGAMRTLGFEHVHWEGAGFMNIWLEDHDEIYVRPDGKKVHIHGKKNQVGHRVPAAHKRIMEIIHNKQMISVENAGTDVWFLKRDDFLNRQQ